MKLLLDTHVWLWALHDPSRLSHRVRDVLRNPANELWLSPVSTWEALLLNARGRIRLPTNLSEWLTAATAPLREAPFTHEIVLIAQQLPLPHRDPADRFLAATAQIMDLTLVTADDNLLRLGTIRTMKN
ncbi:MAG TPA: type II toxin-antitoxin system VapC family toxin [Terriglobales bacterium]